MATIVIESYKVIEACMVKIAFIKEYRHNKNEEIIKRRMTSFKKGWPWARRHWTREEAVEYLDEATWLDSWGYCYAYGHTLNHAEALLKLAQLGDPVTLNEEDIRLIF